MNINKSKHLLIAGIRGTLGQAVKQLAESKGYDCAGTTSDRDLAVKDSLHYLDFTQYASPENFDYSSRIDHLLISSGKEPQKNLSASDHSHIDEMFRIHVIGPMLLIRKLMPLIKKGGSISLLSSPAAHQGSYDPSYAAVKAAVDGLARTLAKELGPDIRVNAFSPSLIKDSPVYNRMTADFREKHLNNTLNKRIVSAEECAKALLFLMESEHMTAQVLHFNGGMVMGR